MYATTEQEEDATSNTLEITPTLKALLLLTILLSIVLGLFPDLIITLI